MAPRHLLSCRQPAWRRGVSREPPRFTRSRPHARDVRRGHVAVLL